MQNIKVLLIEDESPAIEELTYLIKESDSSIEVRFADSGLKGLEMAKKRAFDVFFIDIALPDITGIEAAEEILKINSKAAIVFSTAYDEYAVKAFELNEVDYILKPYSYERVLSCLEKVKEKIKTGFVPITDEIAAIIKKSLKKPNKLVVEKRGKYVVLDHDEIYWIEAFEGKGLIHTYEENYYVNQTMGQLENILEKTTFLRIHRSYFVNLNFIKELEPSFYGAYSVVLKDKNSSKLTVGRDRVKQLKEVLKMG